MAELYVGDQFWDMKKVQEVTVKISGNRSRQEWIQEMINWAESRGMWIWQLGESTHHKDDESWHEAYFLIRGEENRTLFRLRWS